MRALAYLFAFLEQLPFDVLSLVEFSSLDL